jgi:hypothetical protein
MKLNIRKKLVSVAVASALGGGALMLAAPAQAMNVSQNNLGQVLLFPYYTVKNGYDTLFTITNTSDRTTVFKIRWREALNSREVRDFNVILSPYDVWTGVVTNNGSGGALIRTFDNTCTSPILPASGTVSGAREIAFTNALFSGPFTDSATNDISRVQEGYFEVIEMGTSTRATSDSSNVLEYNAKHVSGTPRDCTKVDALFNNVGANLSYLNTPINNLKGHATFINVAAGKAIDTEPTAIENFVSHNIVAAPGDLIPDLGNGDPVGTAYFLDDGFGVSLNYVGGSTGAVDDLLRATSVINEYATGTNASTSWVVTFPTKHFHTDNYTAGTGPSLPGTPDGGFSEWFPKFDQSYNVLATGGKSCDNVGLNVYNREEGTFAPSGTQFSPVPAGSSVELCYEANVIDFNNSSVFGTGTNRLGVNTTTVGTAGWAELAFTEGPAVTAGGLPVIGFAAITRDTGAAIANYGSAVEHAYRKELPLQ